MNSYNFEDLFESKLPYEEMHNGNSMAILGDSLEVLKAMKSNSVTLIFADAPYNIGKDTGITNEYKGKTLVKEKKRKTNAKSKYVRE